MAKGTRSFGRTRGTRFVLAFASLFALIGLIFLTAAWLPVWNDYRHGKQFAANGALALAMVLTRSRASAGSETVLGIRKQLTDYSIRYRFTTHSGQTIEGDAQVTPEEWGFLQERGPVEVRYLPDDPLTNHVSGQVSSRSHMATAVFTLIGAVFTAVGGLMAFVVLKNATPAR